MSDTVPVDFKKVVHDFNQSGYPESLGYKKLKVDSANFDNVTVNLANVVWQSNGIEFEQFDGHMRTIKQTASASVQTNVTVSPDATPGSSINITSGYVIGVGTTKNDARNDKVPYTMKAEIKMPPIFETRYPMYLELTKQQQKVSMPGGIKTKQEDTIPGKGQLDLVSKPTVYQGSFKAKARLSGEVTFKMENGRTALIPIQQMAKEANNRETLQKPFYYDDRALCWDVSGSVDFLVETVTAYSK